MLVIRTVVISERAVKDLRKVPVHVRDKLFVWGDEVRTRGLEEVRKVPGYHDEPLRGDRKGQRSIRLSKAYRAFYTITKDGIAEIALVEEVNKHVY